MPSGTFDNKPNLNMIISEVKFPDGQVQEYTVNLITQNILKQTDSKGFSMTLMDGIVAHQMDKLIAVSKQD